MVMYEDIDVIQFPTIYTLKHYKNKVVPFRYISRKQIGIINLPKPGRRVKLNRSQAVNVHKLLKSRY